MKIKVSITELKNALGCSLKRFPVSFAFIAVLSVTWFISWITDEFHGVLTYYFSIGVLMSLMLGLWGEEQTSRKRVLICQVLCHLALLADALYLNSIYDTDKIDTEYILARFGAITAIWLGVAFLPFTQQRNDVQSWNFVRKLLVNTIICVIIANVMSLGLGGLVFGMNALFGLDIEHSVGKWILSFSMIAGAFTIPATIWMSRVPKGEEKHDDGLQTSAFLRGVTRYLLIPLTCCYLLLLYGYLLKIVIRWELPQGEVSLFVSAMMACIILVEFLLYPTMRSEVATRFERRIVTLLPLLSLPLLVLMTVGIVRRFSDYSITPNRLYVLTLNVWFYIVSGVLYFTSARRIHWIPLSLGCLLLLSSSQPFNYTAVCRWYMLDNVTQVVTQYVPKNLPMQKAEFQEWLSTLPQELQEPTYSQMAYLNRYGHKGDIGQWVSSSVYLPEDYKRFIPNQTPVHVENRKEEIITCQKHSKELILPKGFRREVSTRGNFTMVASDSTHVFQCPIRYEANYGEDSLIITLSINELKRMEQEKSEPPFYYSSNKGDTVTFLPHSIICQHDDTKIQVFYIGNVFIK